MEKEIELDENKQYKMPNFKMVEYKGIYLVIAYETGNWIVLYNEIQKNIFDYICCGHILKEVIEKFADNVEEVYKVLVQLEAKQFTNLNVQNIENGETMQLYITNNCNLRCKHCYMYADYEKENEITLDEIKKLCSNFKIQGGKYVTLTGGEVTTRNDLDKIIKFLHNLDLGIHILSNGVNWSDELIELVAQSNVERVQISLDGFDEKSNSMIRGVGVFDKILDTIDKLVKKNVNVSVAVTPLYEVALKNKEKYIKFSKSLVEKYKDYNFVLNFSFELMEGRNLSKREIEENNKSYMKLMEEINSSVYPNSDIDSFVENHRNNKIFNNCGYGRINVSPTGDIFFCARITDVKKYANIREDSFEEIFLKVKQVRKLSDINNLKPCNLCELKYICGGGCRVNEFPELTQIDDLEGKNNIKPRKCTKESKEKLYKLMIDANERLFR